MTKNQKRSIIAQLNVGRAERVSRKLHSEGQHSSVYRLYRLAKRLLLYQARNTHDMQLRLSDPTLEADYSIILAQSTLTASVAVAF